MSRRHLAHLDDLAARLDRDQERIRNTSSNPKDWKFADKLRDEYHAIRWALRELNPTAGEQEMLDAIVKPLEGAT